jgi:hypothetical protein
MLAAAEGRVRFSEAIRGSGQFNSDWIRKALLSAATGDKTAS